jgi:hypothetical protein
MAKVKKPITPVDTEPAEMSKPDAPEAPESAAVAPVAMSAPEAPAQGIHHLRARVKQTKKFSFHGQMCTWHSGDVVDLLHYGVESIAEFQKMTGVELEPAE